MMLYENITNKSFQPKGITEMIIFFYATYMACDKESSISLDEFIEWLDEHPTMINEFSNWLAGIVKTNNELSAKVEDGEGENEKKN